MAKTSEFAQKLLDDLRLQKQRLATASQSSGRSNSSTPAAVHLPQVLLLVPPLGFEAYEAQLVKRFQLLKAWESPPLSVAANSVKALLCCGTSPVTAHVLRQLPSLQLVVTNSVGVNHIDLLECRRRRIAVASAGHVFSEDVADMAVGLLMDVFRKISAAARGCGISANKGGYTTTTTTFGFKLSCKRVGIVGLGSIGSEVAKRLEAFGCRISYNSRKKKASVSYPYYSNVCELAENSDALIICCGLTDQTRHMINKQVLLALGKKGVIVNIGRGAIIDEKEMVQCLVRGEIGGAGLDVFENEPQVPEELFALDNVVLSPHRAAFTHEAFSDLSELIVGNLEAFFSNKPLLSPVVDN